MSGIRRLCGMFVVGWLLVGCGPKQVATDDPGASGKTNDAGAPSSSGAPHGGNQNGGSTSNSSGAPNGGGAPNDAGAPNNSEAGQGGSDFPVPPPAQGATTFSISAISPPPVGKQCPVVALTDFIPNVPNDPSGALDANTYLNKVIDGEDGVVFKCKVVGTTTFTFEAEIHQAGHAFTLEAGVLSAQHQGTAKVRLTDAAGFAGTLASGADCVVDAKPAAGNNFQVKAGSMWASFSCPTVEAAPSDLCKASGIFVLENCDQE